jgi:predicted DNA binding protein
MSYEKHTFFTPLVETKTKHLNTTKHYHLVMTIRQAIIGVHHKGCWGSESTVPFPSISMKEVGPIDVQKEDDYVRLTATWNVTFEHKETFLAYLDSLDQYKMIEDIRLIRLENQYALLKVTWKNKDSSYARVFNQKCLFVSPVTQEQGYEKYTIITEDPKEVRNILEKLECIGEVKLFSIGKLEHEENKFKLTSKQMNALVLAMSHGYYEWPKHANLNDIAEISGINRRTLQENLRRAETKVFKQMKTELMQGGIANV